MNNTTLLHLIMDTYEQWHYSLDLPWGVYLDGDHYLKKILENAGYFGDD